MHKWSFGQEAVWNVLLKYKDSSHSLKKKSKNYLLLSRGFCKCQTSAQIDRSSKEPQTSTTTKQSAKSKEQEKREKEEEKKPRQQKTKP